MTLDAELMAHAAALGRSVRRGSSPNPWVGSVLATASGQVLASGATEPPGGRHAEIVTLDAAGHAAHGATLYATLEPCSHTGRTGPCTERIVAAGIARVVVAVADPDHRVDGAGLARLREAGIQVDVGTGADEVSRDLAAYLHHRRTGRPFVVLKWAASLDGRTAAPDGSSRWITSEPARRDVHELRAECDAILVGAGTVRRDDPELTVRLGGFDRQPLRVVLGAAPATARVHPCVEYAGSLEALLDDLGTRGIVQLLVEGGARVAHDFVEGGFVNRLVAYVAPMLFGGDDGSPVLKGTGSPSIDAVRRGRFVSAVTVGEDLRVEVDL